MFFHAILSKSNKFISRAAASARSGEPTLQYNTQHALRSIDACRPRRRLRRPASSTWGRYRARPEVPTDRTDREVPAIDRLLPYSATFERRDTVPVLRVLRRLRVGREVLGVQRLRRVRFCLAVLRLRAVPVIDI